LSFSSDNKNVSGADGGIRRRVGSEVETTMDGVGGGKMGDIAGDGGIIAADAGNGVIGVTGVVGMRTRGFFGGGENASNDDEAVILSLKK
jgi:hypothetical protein